MIRWRGSLLDARHGPICGSITPNARRHAAGAWLHALLQLREAQTTKPRADYAVLAYASFHDGRNTFLRKRRSLVARYDHLGPLLQPFARLVADHLRIAMTDVVYREPPFVRVSALAHFLERQYNELEERRYDSRAGLAELVRTFASEARAAGVEPMLATNVDDERTRAMTDLARRGAIPVVDISADLRQPGFRNLPHDGHSSAIAHRAYAERLDEGLSGLLAPRGVVSPRAADSTASR